MAADNDERVGGGKAAFLRVFGKYEKATNAKLTADRGRGVL
jgi:hypothetical protein